MQATSPSHSSASTLNIGGSIRWLRQLGQLPGRVNRRRFLNTKPQAKHWEGSTSSRSLDLLNDFSKCSKCGTTSFSRIPTREDNSRAVAGPCLKKFRMDCRRVSWRSRGAFVCRVAIRKHFYFFKFLFFSGLLNEFDFIQKLYSDLGRKATVLIHSLVHASHFFGIDGVYQTKKSLDDFGRSLG